jgi:hypothetical protein
MRLTRAATLLVVLGALLACKKKSLDDAISERRAGVEKTFAALKQLEPLVTSAPHVETDGVKPTGEPVLAERGDEQNAIVVHAADLSDVTNKSVATLQTTRTKQLADCASILRTKKHVDGITPARGDVAADYLGQCARARYVFVVRAHSYEPPLLTGAETFRPGKFVGDVTLWRIDTRTSFGGFKLVAESKSLTLGPNDTAERIYNSFAAILSAAIEAGIRKHVPGALGPER